MKDKEPQAFGTYDFETYDWVSPLCAATYNGHESTFAIDRTDPIEVTRKLLAELEASDIPVWWAHNGGKFDALFLVEVMTQTPGWKCDGAVANGRIISLRCHGPNGTFTLKDSYAVIQSSLEKALTSFGIEHTKVFTKEDYAKLETDPRAMCKHSDAKLHEGCVADTRALWHLVDKARQMFEEWGGHLKSTFSAGALSVVKGQLQQPLPSHKGHQDKNSVARAAFCGGRVEIFKHSPHSLLTEYDVTSSYPWSMTQPLPWELLGYGAPDLYAQDKRSVVYARVNVPEQYLPPLPYVPPSGGLFFPWGEWSGWFTCAELRYAIEHCGVTAKLHDSIQYTVAQPFDSFVRKVFALKSTSTGALREFCKLILNGCYGKFGQRPETEKLVTFSSVTDAIEWARENSLYDPQPLSASKLAWSLKTERWPAQTHYALASFVTAYSRILLHRRLVEANRFGEGIAYCDTDSIHCDRENVLPVGSDLGQLKVEIERYCARFYAPKLYKLECWNAEQVTDEKFMASPEFAWEPKYASKGFPVSAAAFDRIVKGQLVGNPRGRMQLVKTMLRNNSPVKHLSESETAKQWSGRSNKRAVIPGSTVGDTRAWNVRELHDGAHESQQSPLAPYGAKKPHGRKSRSHG